MPPIVVVASIEVKIQKDLRRVGQTKMMYKTLTYGGIENTLLE